MAYVKYTWQNLPNITTPISKANLDHLETQYEEFTKLYDAHSVLIAILDDTPVVLPVAASRLIGRKAAGNIVALTGAEVLTIAGWTNAKLLLGAGAGVAPTEIDVPTPGGLTIFGDGSDGNVTTAGGGAGDVTLTRDMFYNNLTVTAGDTITTGGFRIFVKDTLTNNETIERNGNNAVNNAVGVALVAGSLGIGEAGGTTFIGSGAGGGGGGVLCIAAKIIDNSSGIISANGGDGGVALGGGAGNNPGGAGTNIVSSLGGNGGVGGSTIGQVGGAIGTATAPTAVMGGFRAIPFIIILKEVETTVVKINGGAGGGGGAQDAANNEFGGGGGGGGGCVALIYNTLVAGTETADGGALGTGNGGGNNGGVGIVGTVIKLVNA